MSYNNAIILLIYSMNIVAMEQPCQFIMSKEFSGSQKSSGFRELFHSECDGSECDCLDIIKWSDFLLRQQQVSTYRHPLMRKDNVPCCGESCEIVAKCVGSSVVLCAPQCCLFGLTRIIIGVVQQKCYPSTTESAEWNNASSFLSTAAISGGIMLRNNWRSNSKKDR